MKQPMRPFEDMRAALLAAATPLSTVEQVPTAEALGRVLAVDQISTLDVPPLDNSSMDGYAVRCADLPAAGKRLVVAQRIPAGSVGHTLAPGTAARIFTGAPIPHGADAVVMQELCSLDGDGVLIDHAPRPGEWIRRAGEDVAAGSTVLRGGQVVIPAVVGLAVLAPAGLPSVSRHNTCAACSGSLAAISDCVTITGQALSAI